MLKHFLLMLFVFFSLSQVVIGTEKTDSIVGLWSNEERSALIEIFKSENKFYGKIVWLKEPLDQKTLKPKTDQRNPQQKKRNRKIIGIVILKDLVRQNDNTWGNGTVYDPNTGKVYRSKVSISSDGLRLTIRGYLGISIFGRTAIWSRSSKKL